jgi:hypothetical protein
MMRAMDRRRREDDARRLADWRVSEKLGGSVLPRWGATVLRPYKDGGFGPGIFWALKSKTPRLSRGHFSMK